MQIKDHILIAKFLFNAKFGFDSNIKRRFFILGCIQPDFNPLTYLKGSFKNKTLHGHNFENSFNYLKKKVGKLNAKEKLNAIDYYNLGKVIHYLADDFTYPHNTEFPENVIEHRRYEKDLHRVFKEYLNNDNKRLNYSYLSKQNIMDFLVKKHDEYMEDKPTFLRDCKYILNVCMNVIGSFEVESYQLELEAA